MTTDVEVLRYARDVVLDSPDHWTRGVLARRKGDGISASFCSVKDGDRFCVLGAIERARWELTGAEPAASWVDAGRTPEARALQYPVGTNDFGTFSDVISLLDEAIKTLEAPDRKDDK